MEVRQEQALDEGGAMSVMRSGGKNGGWSGMNDAHYLFNRTSSERKRDSRGAFARKCGSKSKKCTLPSDYLTPAQKKKMNGVCNVYDISKPMSWTQFRSMPHDLQREYLRKLAEMGAKKADVADMFGTTKSALSQYISKYHNGEKFFTGVSVKNNTAFKKWKGQDKEEAAVPAFETQKNEGLSIEVQSGSMTYTGRPEAVFERVLTLLESSRKYRITVGFETIE